MFSDAVSFFHPVVPRVLTSQLAVLFALVLVVLRALASRHLVLFALVPVASQVLAVLFSSDRTHLAVSVSSSLLS